MNISGISNLIRSGNSWMSATKFDIPYTWLLRAYTSSSQDKELTYNIYRQEEMIASGVKENSYNDDAVTEGVYYKVEALYRNIIVAQSNELYPNKKKDNDMNTSNSIYPNPAKDILHIKASDIRNITIVSTTGDIVFCQDMKGNEFNIDIRHLNSGVYIVRVSTDKEMITEKIVLYNE